MASVHSKWRAQILRVLDNAAKRGLFLCLANDNILTALARLTAYRSAREWLIAFDLVSFASPWWQSNVLAYGNRLPAECGDPPVPNFALVAAPPTIASPADSPLWTADGKKIALNPYNFTLVVRGKRRHFRATAADYKKARIRLDSCASIAAQALRYAVTKLGDEIFLTDEELLKACGRQRGGLKRFIKTTKWRHTAETDPVLVDPESPPSECPTFASLAEALAADDPSLFDPGTDNTDWRLWYPDDAIPKA